MGTSIDGSSVNSTDTGFRYAAYANRIRTILLSAHRYVAYTSDIGESFRPIAHPWLVRSAYTISWTYLLGDVGHEGYKAYLRNWKALAPTGEAYKDASQPSQNQIIKGMATGNMMIGNKAESNRRDPACRGLPHGHGQARCVPEYREYGITRIHNPQCCPLLWADGEGCQECIYSYLDADRGMYRFVPVENVNRQIQC